jgi:hypothetical protein
MTTAPAPLRLHPKMSETYRDRVAALIRGLAEGDGMEEAREALLGLIEKIVLSPRAGGNGIVALAGVEGTVGGDAGDLLIGQHGRVAYVASGELSSPDVERFLVNSNVDLAPCTAFGATMLAPLSGKQSPGGCCKSRFRLPLGSVGLGVF